jgi:hypothetical protein
LFRSFFFLRTLLLLRCKNALSARYVSKIAQFFALARVIRANLPEVLN